MCIRFSLSTSELGSIRGSRKVSPLSLEPSRQRWQWGKPFLLQSAMRTGEHTVPGDGTEHAATQAARSSPVRVLSQAWMDRKAHPTCPLEARAVLGTNRPRATFVRLCRRGWVGWQFFPIHKKLVPSLKKGPFTNDAKLTLLELQGVYWETRSCKNIIERRTDIFPVLKGSFVAGLMLV